MVTPGFTLILPLDRVTTVEMASGDRVEVAGRLVSSLDGSAFDVASAFDLGAGGLRVVDAAPARTSVVLAPTGSDGPACVAAGVPSPCMVPRVTEMAHARLRTAEEFAPTLYGTFTLVPLASPVTMTSGPPLWIGALCMAVACFWMLFAIWTRRARSSLGRVRNAARRALWATRGDATLAPVRRQVFALLARARDVDAVRRATGRALERIDRSALDRRADAFARAAAPEAAAALECLTAERAEVVRLEADRVAALAELERIESTLRVVALRVRGRRDPRAKGPGADAVAALVDELELREQAIAEADAAASPRAEGRRSRVPVAEVH